MIFAIVLLALFFFFFFFNDTATTEIYTLSLHDALPISHLHSPAGGSLCRATITRISSGCSFLEQPGWSAPFSERSTGRRSAGAVSSRRRWRLQAFCLFRSIGRRPRYLTWTRRSALGSRMCFGP